MADQKLAVWVAPMKLDLSLQPRGTAVKPLLLFVAWSLPGMPGAIEGYQPDLAAMALAMSQPVPEGCEKSKRL